MPGESTWMESYSGRPLSTSPSSSPKHHAWPPSRSQCSAASRARSTPHGVPAPAHSAAQEVVCTFHQSHSWSRPELRQQVGNIAGSIIEILLDVPKPAVLPGRNGYHVGPLVKLEFR